LCAAQARLLAARVRHKRDAVRLVQKASVRGKQPREAAQGGGAATQQQRRT
jgi:hypothetical protein